MRKLLVLPLLLAAFAFARPALADIGIPNLIIPPFLPDVCSLGICAQYTTVTALSQIQNLISQIYQIKTTAQNLATFQTTFPDTVAQIGGIIGQGHQVDQTIQADIAAQQIIADAAKNAQDAAKAQADASAADGAQQNQKSQSESLAQINQATQASLAMQGEQQNEITANRKLMSDRLSELTGPADGGLYY